MGCYLGNQSTLETAIYQAGYNGGMNPVFESHPQIPLQEYQLNYTLNAVGFMRLSQYQWSAVIKKSEDLLGRCDRVKARFVCYSSQGDMNQRLWSARLRFAAGALIRNARSWLRDP